jgi:hypothetical protein
MDQGPSAGLPPVDTMRAYGLRFGSEQPVMPAFLNQLLNKPTLQKQVTQWALLVNSSEGLTLEGTLNGKAFKIQEQGNGLKDSTFRLVLTENSQEIPYPLTEAQFRKAFDKLTTVADAQVGQGYGLAEGFDVTRLLVKLANGTFKNDIKWTRLEEEAQLNPRFPSVSGYLQTTVDDTQVTLMEQVGFLGSSTYIALEKAGQPLQILAVSGETEKVAAKALGDVFRLERAEEELETQKQQLEEATRQLQQEIGSLIQQYPSA